MKGGWNPWHGCKKYSEGCLNCYVYRRDESVGLDASEVRRTGEFGLPLRRGRDGRPKLTAGDCWTCMTSDFFIDEADAWRPEAWEMIRQRPDVRFCIITKRILRAEKCLPPDWGDGYPNVRLGCTVENQWHADRRLPVFLDFPARSRFVICEPLLERIELARWLDPEKISLLSAGGESGPQARVCDYDWVLSLRDQCAGRGVRFHFKQTGACFRRDGRLYRVPRSEQMRQAAKAGIG